MNNKQKSVGCLSVLAWMIVIAVIFVVVALIFGKNIVSNPSDAPSQVSTTTEVSVEQVVYENEGLKVVFRGVSDLMGNIGAQFTMTNKGSNEVMVLPESASINDHMVQLFSGVPATIRPGKSFNQVWFTGPDAAGVSSYKDVKEIELVLIYGPSDAISSKGKSTKLIHIDV